MHANWKTWAHVTKLDPDKHLPPGAVEEIVTSGTDALMLSGTLNVTQENLRELLDVVSAYGLPLVVEPASPDCAIFDGEVDHLFVPSVMNTNDARWIVGKHHAWLRNSGSSINWDIVVPEAYIVLNPASAVGRVTGADCDLSRDDVIAFVGVADRYFRFPIVYIEYSGIYGDPDIVRAASDAVENSILYYGGGIRSAEQAAEMGEFADTIIVGNAVYDDGVDALRATVRAVQ